MRCTSPIIKNIKREKRLRRKTTQGSTNPLSKNAAVPSETEQASGEAALDSKEEKKVKRRRRRRRRRRRGATKIRMQSNIQPTPISLPEVLEQWPPPKHCTWPVTCPTRRACWSRPKSLAVRSTLRAILLPLLLFTKVVLSLALGTRNTYICKIQR